MKNIKEKIEIGGVLIMALLISVFASKLFFINNTPQLRAGAATDIGNTVLSWIKDLTPKNTARKTAPAPDSATVFSNLGQVAFSPVAQGVTARENSGASETVYEVDKVTWKEYSYTTKEGQSLKLKVAAGQNPPPQALIDLLK